MFLVQGKDTRHCHLLGSECSATISNTVMGQSYDPMINQWMISHASHGFGYSKYRRLSYLTNTVVHTSDWLASINILSLPNKQSRPSLHIKLNEKESNYFNIALLHLHYIYGFNRCFFNPTVALGNPD